ncbi:MAG: hypothetical protein RLZ10_3128 [Bacteroidota bacterium]|jgi:hypothetical protein
MRTHVQFYLKAEILILFFVAFIFNSCEKSNSQNLPPGAQSAINEGTYMGDIVTAGGFNASIPDATFIVEKAGTGNLYNIHCTFLPLVTGQGAGSTVTVTGRYWNNMFLGGDAVFGGNLVTVDFSYNNTNYSGTLTKVP